MTPEELEDEGSRPAPPSYPAITRAERAHGRRLAAIHDMYRAELDGVQRLLAEVRAAQADPSLVAPAVAGTALARNMAQFGTACGATARFCRTITTSRSSGCFRPLRSAAGRHWPGDPAAEGRA